MEKKILLGLGNPGKEYEKTRHNAGFMAIDALAERYGFPKFSYDASLHVWISGMPFGETLYLLAKPDTFMNRSGLAAKALLTYYRLETDALTILYDDIDIPLGTMRYREKGSAGTHNGMRSLVSELATQDIARIRLGIQPEHPITDLSAFVLGRMSTPEQISMDKVFDDLKLPLDLA